MPPPAWGPPPPTWGPPPSRRHIDEAAHRGRLQSSANLLVVAAVLHVAAGALSFLVLTATIPDSPIPGLSDIVYAIAVIGLVAQITFAAIAGAGFAFLPRGGTNVVSLGTALLVVGILAAVFSIAVSGGFIGVIAGALTAYAGNKVRKPPTPAWIPPSSWMPPPQPPTPPPSP